MPGSSSTTTSVSLADPSMMEDEMLAVGPTTGHPAPRATPERVLRAHQQGPRPAAKARWSDLARRHLSNSGILRWAVPLDGMLLLLGLYAGFHDVFKPMPSLPVLMVIMLSTWLGGRVSGMFATALGALLIAYAYLPPDDSLEVTWPDGVLLLGGFIGLGILMSIVIASVDSSQLKRELKRSVPPQFKHFYRAVARVLSSSVQPLRVRGIDLERTLIGGYNAFSAGDWADFVGEPRCASMLLGDSPHVRFLEDYGHLGEAVFEPAHFEQTAYFTHALEAIRVAGDYFGYTTREGVVAQARAFVTLYERIRTGDRTEVRFGKPQEHSASGSLPVVHRTWTPGAVQIVHGHHRLAIAWVLGQRVTRAVITPAQPTELQRLALGVKQTKQLRELYQPIDSPEFDGTWRLTRRCDDRLQMMERFLATRELTRDNYRQEPPSMVDLACSYGWFVAEFVRRGWQAHGVEADPSAIRIGRIAYGLGADQATHSTIQAFLNETHRKFDVVLCLSILHHFLMNPRTCRAEDLLRRVDAITGSVLFFDIGQNHEEWFKERLPEWDDAHIVEWIRQNTSFTEVIKLGVDSDDVGPYRTNYRRSLFACIRN